MGVDRAQVARHQWIVDEWSARAQQTRVQRFHVPGELADVRT